MSQSAYRRMTVITCGFIVALMVTVFPQNAKAFGGECNELYRDVCVPSTEQCVDCNDWCETLGGSNCVADPEGTECSEDLEYCKNMLPQNPIYHSCACEEEIH
jgi:hypothetical protein